MGQQFGAQITTFDIAWHMKVSNMGMFTSIINNFRIGQETSALSSLFIFKNIYIVI